MRKWIFLSAAILCAAGLAAVLIIRPANWWITALLFFAAVFVASVLFAADRKRLIQAAVIVENTIIHIQPAVINAKSAEEKEIAEKIHESTTIYISCFGILMGSKLIKWCDGSGVRLKSVEIGSDYIYMEYGAKNAEIKNIRLLYFKPDDEAELADIVEKFRFKTGIVPVIA